MFILYILLDPLVKRLRHNAFTITSWVQFPSGLKRFEYDILIILSLAFLPPMEIRRVRRRLVPFGSSPKRDKPSFGLVKNV